MPLTEAEKEELEFLELKRRRRPKGTPVSGALEVAGTIVSGIVAEPVSGLAGIAGGVLPGPQGQGVDWIESTREAMTYQPRTETGTQYLQNIGKGIEYIDNLPRGVAGQSISEGMTQASEQLGRIGEELMSPFGKRGKALGYTAGSMAIPGAGIAAGARSGKAITHTKTPKPERVDPRVEGIRRGDADAADYTLTPEGKVKRDKAAREAQYQGMEPGMVAAFKAASPVDKRSMNKMLDIVEIGLTNRRAGATLYPSSVVGRNIASQYEHVARVNKSAGKRLDGVAQQTLKGVDVDYAPAVDNFLSNLEELGVKINRADMSVGFDGSALKGIGGNEKVIERVIDWMSYPGARTDAYGVHLLKRYLDENIEYGKSTEGVTRKVQNALQGLRHDLNELLRDSSDEYRSVNIEFSETRAVMDELQDAVSSKIDFSGPNLSRALGIEARKLLSNYASGTNQLDALENLTAIANKYGGNFSDDIVTQTMFFVQLQHMFPETFRTTFKSEIAKGVEEALRSSPEQAITKAAIDKGVELVRGSRGEKELLLALRRLLSEQPSKPAGKPGLPAPRQ